MREITLKDLRELMIVRCKDCKHRPYGVVRKIDGATMIHRPLKIEGALYDGEEDETCPFLCDDCHYDRMPPDDFFCAYGEKR